MIMVEYCFVYWIEETSRPKSCRTRSSAPSLLAGSWNLFEIALVMIACTTTAEAHAAVTGCQPVWYNPLSVKTKYICCAFELKIIDQDCVRIARLFV